MFLPTNVLERADELRFSLSSLGRNLLKVSGFYAANGGCAASSYLFSRSLLIPRVKMCIFFKARPPRSDSIPQLITHSFVHNSVPAPVISCQDALPQSRGLLVDSI